MCGISGWFDTSGETQPDAKLIQNMTAAIRHLKTSQWERDRQQDRVARVKAVLQAAGLPMMPNETHIIPVIVGDSEKCKTASDLLLADQLQDVRDAKILEGSLEGHGYPDWRLYSPRSERR